MTVRTILAGVAFGALCAAGAAAQTAPASAPQAATPPGAATASAAAQPAAAGIAQGATVTDPQGGKVGTVESIDGDFVVLATAKSKVRLPKSSFAIGQSGPVIAMTATQIDAAAAQAAPSTPAPAAKPAVVVGAEVIGPQGGTVGTVSEADARLATLTLASGGKVRLPVNSFGADADGKLRIAMTEAQLSAAAAAAGGSTPK